MGVLDSQAFVGFVTITIPALATIYASRKGNKRNGYADKYIHELERENAKLRKNGKM